MKRRDWLASAGALTATLACAMRGVAVGAPMARIGWVTAQRAESLAPYLAAFRAGLSGFGLVEGRNLTIDYRYGDDVVDRVPVLVDDLVRRGVQLIVAQGAAVTLLDRLRPQVPIVYVTSVDPVAAGFADSLARPRPHMTGLTFMSVEFNGKRLELLREIVPALRRVAIVANPEHPGEDRERSFSIDVGRRLGIDVTLFATRTAADLDAAFASIGRKPPQAISLFSDGFAVQYRQRIIDAANRLRIPVVAGWAVFAESGALCSYGPRLIDSYQRLAYYVERILKGAKPAELPIEQPTTFEMVLNRRTANALGLALPQSVLVRADRVID